MNEQIKNLGLKFKKKREEMHLSLKEVENATSIRMAYVQAIEEGTIGKYLSPVYTMGFIKQYANFLGFDADAVIKENQKAFACYKKNKEFDFGIGSIDVRGADSTNTKWGSNILWIGISLTVLVLAWFFAKFLGVV